MRPGWTKRLARSSNCSPNSAGRRTTATRKRTMPNRDVGNVDLPSPLAHLCAAYKLLAESAHLDADQVNGPIAAAFQERDQLVEALRWAMPQIKMTMPNVYPAWASQYYHALAVLA